MHHEPRQLDERDSTGQRLSRQPDEVGSGAAEYEEPPRPPTLVDEHAQDREEIGAQLRFVNDNGSAKRGQAERWFTETRQVSWILQVEEVVAVGL